MTTKKKFTIASCAVVLAVSAGIIAWLWSISGATSRQSEPVRVNIPRGVTAEQLADTLSAHLDKDFADNVLRLWQMQGSKPVHGSFVVRPEQTAMEVSRMLINGQQTPVRVTFNNARTIEQMIAKIAPSLEASEAELMAACDSILPTLGYSKATFPAAFFPDTYEFYWTNSADKVISKLVGYRDGFWTEERVAKAKALGLTPVQVTTIASIVEEETAKADERGKVARLYLNRLKKGWKLQADPTVKFAVGDFGLRRISKKHLDVESPYNTYRHEGLPPGPIRIAEKRTCDAVLNAPQHNYLFMCAKEDFSGYHNFAVDLATHNANAARYHRKLNELGIR